ncbi:MAG: hypothetical protein ACFB6R_03395 [Alphaproteobacteria bacterium]
MSGASSFLRGLTKAFTPSDRAWNGAVRGLWLVTAFVLLAVFIGAVLLNPSIGSFLAFGVLLVFIGLVGIAVRILHALIVPLPGRYVLALIIGSVSAYLTFTSGVWSEGGGLLASLVLFLAVTLCGGGLAVLLSDGLTLSRGSVAVLAVAAGAAGLGLTGYGLVREGEPLNPALEDFVFEDRTLDLPDPGQAGPYTVATFSYGSGRDRHRQIFGEAASWTSRSVDGSKLIDAWDGPSGWARSRYWGFDETALPIQGQVWAPGWASAGVSEAALQEPEAQPGREAGPYPLVLIVHGNHSMEDYSDPGYAYLGDHFASRGFITVSVDENFINGTFGDVLDLVNPDGPEIGGGLEEENDARGWLLLEHLAQWREWNADPAHPFYGKVDLDRVVLIGHSRGGEAVAVAAHFNGLSRYPGDGALAFDYGFGIKGVIAIAPVDGQYKPRGRGTPITGVNYFTVHGSMDGDVESFMGQTQYSRVDVSGSEDLFKASLYVKDANHGQFNTSWGRMDYGLPRAALLNLDPILEPQDQRQIALVTFSVFLEAALNDRRAYLPVLADARTARTWLPDVVMVSNFESGAARILADYEEDGDLSTGRYGVQISATHVTRWTEKWLKLKWRSLEDHGVLVAWDDRVHRDPAQYVLRWSGGTAVADDPEDQVLRFAAAQASVSSLPKDWEEDGEKSGGPDGEGGDTETDDTETADGEMREDKPDPLDWTVILYDADGRQAALPLSTDRRLYPAIKAHTRRLQMLSDTDTSEIVMRRFALPLSAFRAVNPDLDPARISGVTFRFDKSPRGAIILDDIGFVSGF